MRHLMNHLFWLTILISGLATGLGCNALPNPMPSFDLGQVSGKDMNSRHRDAPSTAISDGGAGDMGAVPSADGGVSDDAFTDAIGDGIKESDGAGDAMISDGEVDGTSDALAADGDVYSDFSSED